MTVIGDRRSHVAGDVLGDVAGGAGKQWDESNRSTAGLRKPWVKPTWERRDTPMEVTMYAGQR